LRGRPRPGRSLSAFFFYSSRRRHTRSKRDWSSDVCSSDLELAILSEEVSGEFKIPVKREKKSVEVPTGKRNLLGIEQKKTVMKSTGNVILKDEVFQDLKKKVK